jgi:para-nitrobenzyl esterase
MSNESSKTRLGRIDRRTMLGTTTAVLGGVMVGAAGDAFGQEKPKPAATAGSADTSTAGPNLAPPVVDTTCGKLRGLREGKTVSFLGIRYAEAERFGLPKPVQPWEGIKNAQVWGPVCPASSCSRIATSLRTSTASI